MHRFGFLLAACGLAAAASAQFNVTIPDGYATAVENSANAFPFASTISPTYTGLRILHIYDSTHFTNQGITYPIVITGLKWRAQDLATTTTWAGGTYNQATIQMSTAPVDHTGASTTWAANHGANLTTVHNGAVVVQPGAGNGVGVPGPFHIDVQFPTAPFVYDPNTGDLSIDVDVPGGSWGGGGFTALASVTAAGVPAPVARRVYSSSMYPNANAVDTNILVMQLDYHPAAGLYAGFTANVRSGQAPLAVQFTDQTFTSDPGGVTSWAWDLDGDGTTDSTVQNPSFVYPTCGNFNVRLTVTDATHTPSTLTRTAYIATDNIAANFSHALIAPLVVQFTDTSNMAATAWAWDLNGDNLVDSNLQNPAFAYPNTNPVAVTLTATRNCQSSTYTKTIVPAQEITTLFTGGNSGAALWTVYFDAQVTNPLGMNVNGFATNSTNAANTAFSLDFYVKGGTYQGAESAPAQWRLVGTATGTTAGPNQPSYATLAAPVHLAAGNYGLALRYNSVTPSYTNGTGTNQSYNNGDVILTLGAAQATTTAPFTGGTPFTPRVWNGTIFYETHNISSVAGYGYFASGCPGSLGTTNLLHSNRPQLGQTLSVTLNNLPQSAAFMATGFSRTVWSQGTLPANLAVYGMPNCFGYVSPDAVLFIAGANNTATWNFSVTNDPAFLGLLMFNQAFVLDPGVNPLGAVASDAAALLVGN